jgi:hypothetical protein
MTTLGDIIYGGASGVATRLAGNTTTTRKFLRQTGDATNSAAPAWDILVSGDIPNNAANTTGSAATLTTARNFTINGTAKSFDGSANVSWTAAEIGLTSYLPLTGGTLTGNLSISTVFTSGNIPFLVNNTTGWGFYNGAESTLDFNYGRNETSTGYINYVGYQGGSTQFRNLIIADGKGNTIATFTGSTKQTSLSGALSGTSASFSSFITAQSTGGSGLRIYGGSGTNQWDIYLNSTNLRFSDNTGTGSVVFDRPLSGTSATFSNDVYVQESGNALLRVHSNTTSTPIADIELMRGTNATWGADAYGDYRIRNSGGDLIFQYGDTGVTSTRFTIQSSGNAAFNSTASFAGNVTLSGGSDLIITPATSGVNATLYNDIGVLVSTASISVQGTGVFSSSVSATSATFTTSITPLIIKGTNAATMWTEYYYNTSTLSGYIGSGDGLLSGANASDFIVRSQADFVIAAGGNNRRLTIGSTGAATFSSAVAGYAMSITNVEDSSQGLLLRSTDADTTLYLARFQSSASAVSQTWVDRFSIAKSGNAVLGDNIPYANIRFYIKGEDQGAGNYALNIADGSGQDIAWFRNDKAIRFLGATTLTYTYNGGGNGMLHLTSGGTEGGSITFEKTSGTAQKYKVGNSGTEFFIYNETAGNKPFALENNGVITTRSSSTEPFKIYGDTAGINGLLRIQIDEVNDSFGTGARTFIGDGGIDIFIGTGNSSYTPANSYIALNHSGEISMGAGSATKHLTIATTGTSTFRNSLLANSPSEGATGEGLIAGQSFKIDATGTGQTAKMYIVSNTLSNTYGSGLTLQAANFAGDKGFGFNLSSSYSGAFELYLRSSSTWALRYRFRPSGRTDWSNDSYMVSDTNGFRFNDSTDSYNNFVALNNGNATLRGTLTQNASDLRLKNNIRKIESALNKVQKINGVTFDWLENIESLGFSPKNKINDAGVIAQEIKDVLPQAVDYAPFDMKDGKSISGNNYLTVHYEKIVPLLIEAIKELKTEVDSLKK